MSKTNITSKPNKRFSKIFFICLLAGGFLYLVGFMLDNSNSERIAISSTQSKSEVHKSDPSDIGRYKLSIDINKIIDTLSLFKLEKSKLPGGASIWYITKKHVFCSVAGYGKNDIRVARIKVYLTPESVRWNDQNYTVRFLEAVVPEWNDDNKVAFLATFMPNSIAGKKQLITMKIGTKTVLLMSNKGAKQKFMSVEVYGAKSDN